MIFEKNKAVSCVFFSLLAVFSTVFAGCAAFSPAPRTMKDGLRWERGGEDEGWWYARFRWNWPPEEKPLWRLDYVAAHRIAAPALEKFGPEIGLWRFHRRAARDNSGHQFSLVVYSSRDTASRVFQSLDSDPLATDLKKAGLLETIVFDDLNADPVPRPGIEDTSDKNWPLSVQKSWPYYIMGSSRMWVELIDQMAMETGREAEPFALDDLVAFYGMIEQEVLRIWQEKGNHAFLHHLNAIFGYEPLVVHEKRMMQF